MSRFWGVEILRASEHAALVAGRQQGRGGSMALLSKAREAMMEDILCEPVNFSIKNDRFAEHPSIYPLPKSRCSSPDAEMHDLQVVPVDGHKVTAHGGPNAASYIALAEKGSFMSFPYLYMNKIAVGAEAGEVVDIEAPPAVNVRRVARALKKYVDNITVCFLDRDRNRDMIEEVRQSGARILLIQDGDISASLATVFSGHVDMMMGYGGAQEGVLTAVGMKCLGGYIVGRLYLPQAVDRARAEKAGIKDFRQVYDIGDFVRGDNVSFVGTGITDGYLLDGVKFERDGATTHSILARGATKTRRDIRTRHYFDYKQVFV